jgi:phage shock protein A
MTVIEQLVEALKAVYLTCDWHGDDGKDAMQLASKAIAAGEAELAREPDNRQQVLEKEHTEFYSEVVTLRSTVEHLRLRENRLTAERDSLKEDYTRIKESAALWHDRYKTKCQESVDRLAILGAEIVALEAAIGEKK